MLPLISGSDSRRCVDLRRDARMQKQALSLCSGMTFPSSLRLRTQRPPAAPRGPASNRIPHSREPIESGRALPACEPSVSGRSLRIAADFHIHRPQLGQRPNTGARDPHPNLTPSARPLSALA
ncbi:unnamed protein product [Gadus morhua 'NCC']